MAYTPWGNVDLTNRLTLFDSLAAIPAAAQQQAINYIDATQPGHSTSPLLKLAVGAVLGSAAGGAFTAAGEAMGISSASAATVGGSSLGMFDGLGDFLSVGKDILSGISSVSNLLKPVYDLASPALAYGATQDQLSQQYRIFQESKDFSAQQSEQAWLRGELSSSTAYQKATKDLEAAGLNPMLAYRNGGASTVSTPGASAPAYPNVPSPGMNAVTTALQVRGLAADVALKEANARVASAQEAKTTQETSNLGTIGKQLAFELEKILPARQVELIQHALQMSTQSNVNQANARVLGEQVRNVINQANLSSGQLAKVDQEIRLLMGDLQWQDAMKAVPALRVILEAIRSVGGRR
nr:MAG: DNA pilot protein [Microvirus sp.]